MTTTTASATGHSLQNEKEKVEKRRALGRGLESLLPGPRVVAGIRPPVVPGSASSADAGTRPGIPSTIGHSPLQDESRERENPHPSTGLGQAFSQNRVEVGHPVPTSFGATAKVMGTIRAGVEETVEEGAEPRSGEPLESALSGQSTAVVPQQSGEETITIDAQAESRIPTNLVMNLAIADIYRNPYQTREVQDDEKLEELAESIKANGVVQPVVVRPGEVEGHYILILGERRLHASRKAGKDTVPAIVRRVSAQQAAEMTIIENLQREDLTPLEQAEAFRKLSNEFQLTQQEIAERVGLSRVSVANYMRLLKLPRQVMQLLAEKRINFAKAKELLKLESDDKIAEAAVYAVKKGMTLEQVEMLVLRMEGVLDPLPAMPGQEKERKKSGARWVDPNVRAAQMELERLLGVRVRIRDRKGKGRIVIEYSTVDDYERVVGMLRAKK